MKLYIAACFVLTSFAGSVFALDVYRWVDANGKAHVSDIVPEKYLGTATRTSTQKYELSPDQHAEGELRAAQEKARVERLRIEREEKERNANANAEDLEKSRAAEKKEMPATTSCETLWNNFIESSACFGPFRNANGSLRSGAFEACTDTRSPAPVCQIRTIK